MKENDPQTMQAETSYAELVNKKLAGEITALEFIEESPLYEDYLLWCKEHGEEPSESNANLFIDMTEDLAVNSNNL
jgi:thiamine monophosphate synthase